jgi:L-glyceraldehyde reductase
VLFPDYLDLYLIHYPIAFAKSPGLSVTPSQASNGGIQTVDIPLIDTWKAMEELVRRKRVRAIGVSNFSLRQLNAILPQAT